MKKTGLRVLLINMLFVVLLGGGMEADTYIVHRWYENICAIWRGTC